MIGHVLFTNDVIGFGILGESVWFTRNKAELLAIFHRQSEIIDQDCVVFFTSGQHLEGPCPTVSSFNHLHFNQLVLRMAQRGAGIRVI